MVNKQPRVASGGETAPLADALPAASSMPTPPVYNPLPVYAQTGSQPAFGTPDYDSYIRSISKPDVGIITGGKHISSMGGAGGGPESSAYNYTQVTENPIWSEVDAMSRLLYGPADAPPPDHVNQGYSPGASAYNPALPSGYGSRGTGPTSLGPADPIIGGFRPRLKEVDTGGFGPRLKEADYYYGG